MLTYTLACARSVLALYLVYHMASDKGVADFSPCEPESPGRHTYALAIHGIRTPSPSPPMCRLTTATSSSSSGDVAPKDVVMQPSEMVKIEPPSEVTLQAAPVANNDVTKAASTSAVDTAPQTKKGKAKKPSAGRRLQRPSAANMDKQWVWTNVHGWLRVNVATDGPIPIRRIVPLDPCVLPLLNSIYLFNCSCMSMVLPH